MVSYISKDHKDGPLHVNDSVPGFAFRNPPGIFQEIPENPLTEYGAISEKPDE
jgi:hypothetical protein